MVVKGATRLTYRRKFGDVLEPPISHCYFVDFIATKKQIDLNTCKVEILLDLTVIESSCMLPGVAFAQRWL